MKRTRKFFSRYGRVGRLRMLLVIGCVLAVVGACLSLRTSGSEGGGVGALALPIGCVLVIELGILGLAGLSSGIHLANQRVMNINAPYRPAPARN